MDIILKYKLLFREVVVFEKYLFYMFLLCAFKEMIAVSISKPAVRSKCSRNNVDYPNYEQTKKQQDRKEIVLVVTDSIKEYSLFINCKLS